MNPRLVRIGQLCAHGGPKQRVHTFSGAEADVEVSGLVGHIGWRVGLFFDDAAKRARGADRGPVRQASLRSVF